MKTVTEKFIDEATGTEIAPRNPVQVQYGTSYNGTPKVIDKYTFTKSDPATSNGTVTITNVRGDGITVTYYYKRSPVNVSVIHFNQTTGARIQESNYKIEFGTDGGTYYKLSDYSIPKTLRYNGFTCSNGTTGEESNTELDLPVISDDVVIIFNYVKDIKINYIAREKNSGVIIKNYLPADVVEVNTVMLDVGDKTTTNIKTITKKSENFTGYTYKGYIIEDSSNGYSNIGDLNTVTPTNNTTATITIPSVDNEEKISNKLVTFIYEIEDPGISINVRHMDIEKKADMSDLKGSDIKANATYSFSEIFMSLLQKLSQQQKEEVVNVDYANIIKNSVSQKDKTVSLLDLIIKMDGMTNEYDFSNDIRFRSLNLSGYPGYTYIDTLVETQKINTTEVAQGRFVAALEDIKNMIKDDVVTITGGIIHMTFNYSKTHLVTIKHIDNFGTVIEESTERVLHGSSKDATSLDAQNTTTTNSKYRDLVHTGCTVNGTAVKTEKDVSGIKGTYKITVPSVNVDTTIIFKYCKEKVPEDKPKENPTNKVDNEIVKGMGSDSAVIVLDEKFAINFENEGKYEDGTEWQNKTEGFSKKITFPFDVYYNDTYYPADTTISIDMNEENPEFILPVWVKENLIGDPYKIELEIVDQNSKTIASGDRNRRVIGKIYDYTVTNLKGDTIWKDSLFNTDNNEYKAPNLGIGQETQKPAKYDYGIKLGSTFYFSVNTKGAENSSINITPKILYANNGSVTDVTDKLYYYTAGKKLTQLSKDNIISLQTKLNNTERYTTEIKSEIARAKKDDIKDFYKAITGAFNNVNFGTFRGLKIATSLRTPYVNYLTGDGSYDAKGIYGKTVAELIKNDGINATEADVLKQVSHWYAEYRLPSTTMLAADGNVANAKKPTTGYYIILFSISSNNNDKAYLEYGEQWKIENPKYANDMKIALPDGNEVTIPSTDISGYRYPVAIYQANISINDDIEDGGTH